MKNKKNEKKNKNSEINDDILNDVRNLFINEDEIFNEGNEIENLPHKDEILFTLPKDETEKENQQQQQQQPVEVIQLLPVIPIQSSSSSYPVEEKILIKESQEMADTKKKIPQSTPPPPPPQQTKQPADSKKLETKPQSPKTITTDKPVTKPTKTTTEIINKPETKKKDKCNNNKDCDNNSFCIIKTGKCTAKLTLGQSGCFSNDHCISENNSSVVVCDKSRNKCLKACKNEGNTNNNCDGGQVCFKVTDLKIFKGLDGGSGKNNIFNGVCDSAESSKPTIKPLSQNNNHKTSKTKIVMLSGSFLILLTVLILGFIYLRGYLIRRNRDNNPELFLFDRLQKSSSQAAIPIEAPTQAQVLHSKLSVGGARFTRWGALTPNYG